jgi:hypothetical protein
MKNVTVTVPVWLGGAKYVRSVNMALSRDPAVRCRVYVQRTAYSTYLKLEVLDSLPQRGSGQLLQSVIVLSLLLRNHHRDVSACERGCCRKVSRGSASHQRIAFNKKRGVRRLPQHLNNVESTSKEVFSLHKKAERG